MIVIDSTDFLGATWVMYDDNTHTLPNYYVARYTYYILIHEPLPTVVRWPMSVPRIYFVEPATVATSSLPLADRRARTPGSHHGVTNHTISFKSLKGIQQKKMEEKKGKLLDLTVPIRKRNVTRNR